MIGALLTVALAFALWGVMFGLEWGNFWLNMTCAALVLAVVGLALTRAELRDTYSFRLRYVVVGVLSAIVLYGVFFIGDFVSAMIFPFASAQVGSIYAMKTQMNPIVIGFLLLFIIGPAEEVFWRGFLQHRLAKRWGHRIGWLVASCVYAAVHVWSWNFMLIMAALVCGFFWGAMFLRWKSVWPGIVSHALWDVLVFLILPIRPIPS